MVPLHRTYRAPRMPDDPLPWLTPRFVDSGCFDLTPAGDLMPAAQDALLGAIRGIVSGLQDDSHVYSVSFAPVATAATSTLARSVVVGTKPAHDRNITDGQRAAILLGEAYHEVGHIRYGRDRAKAVLAAFGSDPEALRLSNIAEDVRIEQRLAVDLPGYRDSLITTLWWVGHRGRRLTSDPDFASRGAMVDEVCSIIRFPWLRDWTGHGPEVAAWAERWRVWADGAAKAHSPAKHIEVVQQGLDILAEGSPIPLPEPGPVMPPPPIGRPEPGEEPEEDPDYLDDDGPMAPPDPDAEPEWTPPSSPEPGSEPGEDKDEDVTDEPDGEDTDGEGKDEPDDLAEDDLAEDDLADGDGGDGDDGDVPEDAEDTPEDTSEDGPGDDTDGEAKGEGKADDDEPEEDEDNGLSTDGDDFGEGEEDPDPEESDDDADDPEEGEPVAVDAIPETHGSDGSTHGDDPGIPDACPITYAADPKDAEYQSGIEARTRARRDARGERVYTFKGRTYPVVRQAITARYDDYDMED